MVGEERAEKRKREEQDNQEQNKGDQIALLR